MIKKILLLSTTIILSHNAYSYELREALEHAYKENPTIKKLQENFYSTAQKYPETLSSHFLPDIRASSQNQDSKVKSRSLGASPGYPESKANSVKIEQNLFNGGSSVAALAKVSHTIMAEKYKYLIEEQEFLTKAIEVYVNYIIAEDKVEATKAYVASAQKEYDATEARLKVGEATKVNLAATKSQLAEALFAISKSQADLATSKVVFISYFGREPENLLFPEIPEGIPADLESFKLTALENNYILKANSHNNKAAKNGLRESAGSLLPKASLSASQSNQFSDSNVGTNINPTYYRAKQKSYSTTLSLDIPILSRGGAEHSRIRMARSQHRASVYELENSKNQFEIGLIDTWEKYQSSKLMLDFANEALNAKHLQYEGMKSAYEVGLEDIIKVLKTESELFDQKLKQIDAKQKLIISAYKLKAFISELHPVNLGLNVDTFEPQKEFNRSKFKIIGF